MKSLIIRDKTDATKQMQLLVDAQGEVAVVLNSGLELLIIEKGFSEDVPLSIKEGK